MYIVLIRTIILYILIIIAMRLMGKRQIGELQPYEFAITMLIADLAALPMQDTRLPLLLGIIPIFTLLFMKTAISYLQLKFQISRKILEGEPCILISRGKINFKALKKQQINLDELMEELRLAGYFDIAEIEYAILENNGQMSFLTSSNAYAMSQKQQQSQASGESSNTSSEGDKQYQSLGCGNGKITFGNNHTSNQPTPKINKKNKEPKPLLPKIYVVDGKVNTNSFSSISKNKVWIENELKKHKIDSIEKVLIAMTDTSGRFIYQLYEEYEEDNKK